MAHARHPEVRLASLGLGQVQTHKPHTVTFDLADPGAIVGAAAEILRCFGHVDVLINNAGISYRGAVVDTSLDVDKRVMETNYFGPVALTKGSVSAERGAPAPASCPPGPPPWSWGPGPSFQPGRRLLQRHLRAPFPATAASGWARLPGLALRLQTQKGGPSRSAVLPGPSVVVAGPLSAPPWSPRPPAGLLGTRRPECRLGCGDLRPPRPPSAPALHDPKAPGPHRRHQQHPGEDQHPLPVGV